MGMYYDSQAVLYLGSRLSAEFASSGADPAKGLPYWQGSSDEAVEFRAVLDGSTKKKSPALGSITLEYFDMTIPDSVDGEWPGGPDPSSGKSYKRWIIFWKHFRKNHPSIYNRLINSVIEVLNGTASGITSMTFKAVEDSSTSLSITPNSSGNRAFTLYTAPWHKQLPKAKPAKKKAAKKKKA